MVDADVEGALLPKTDFSLTDFAEIVQRYVKEFPTHYTRIGRHPVGMVKLEFPMEGRWL
jgi:hypothetical protein